MQVLQKDQLSYQGNSCVVPKQKQQNTISQPLLQTKNPNSCENKQQIPLCNLTNSIESNENAQEQITEAEIKQLQIYEKQPRLEDYQISHIVGDDALGQIYLAEQIQNKAKGITQKYAIKCLLLSFFGKHMPLKRQEAIKKILKQLKSRFLTKIYKTFKDQKNIYQVMELGQGGDCYSLIDQKSSRLQDFKKEGQGAVRFILGCIILGICHLHSKGIIHRGLTPQNALIFQNGYVKLNNFFLAQQIKEDKINEIVGVIFYMAPQMILKQNYGKQLDLWTIGIFAYQMSNYYPPFSSEQIRDRQKIKEVVQSAEIYRDWKNSHISQQLKDFINSLLKFEPKERLGSKTLDELKNHNFFTCVKFDWEGLEQMKVESPLKSIIEKHKLKYKAYAPKTQA